MQIALNDFYQQRNYLSCAYRHMPPVYTTTYHFYTEKATKKKQETWARPATATVKPRVAEVKEEQEQEKYKRTEIQLLYFTYC